MSRYLLSQSDRELQSAFESGSLPPAEFSHKVHVALAYAYLAQGGVDAASRDMRAGLIAYLAHQGIDPAKFHETLTQAWVLAVWHFMQRTVSASSADDFIAQNPLLLDTKIMLTHYSASVLFSPGARQRFVAPDLDSIPGGAAPNAGARR